MAKRPESYKLFVEIIGEKSARELCSYFGGEMVYVPKIESIQAAERIEQIRAEASQFSTRELARKYGLTDTRVRQIIKGKKPKE